MSELDLPNEVRTKVIETGDRLRKIFDGTDEKELPNPFWIGVKI